MDKLRILVIDDQKVIGDLFDFTLGFSGHLVTIFDNASDGLAAVKEKEFDIVFLDMVMPDMDGPEVLEEIKKLAPGLPVVVMSGYSVEDKKTKARELGAVTFLKKPFEMDDVKKVIRETLGKDV